MPAFQCRERMFLHVRGEKIMNIEKAILAGLAVIVCGFFASGEEIVLQNGLNGYNGCVDAHISTGQEQGFINSNFCDKTTLICGYHHRL